MAATDTSSPREGDDPRSGLSIRRYFTESGTHPFDTVEWEVRDARIGHGEKVAFEQPDVEFPKSWSQNATNIVAQKYFRGQLGSPERENSVKQMIGRVSGTIADWGRERGYFATTDDADAFEDELTHILLYQMGAFNSPVWFNVGFEEAPQCSACFILSVDDHLDEGPNSLLAWNTKEGKIFRGGSGSGINLSNVRGSGEALAKGGTASGPVSFMRGADSWAGTIKSGGKTRRAAKMVILNVDHPDIREFIWCKAKEEDKAQALRDAGFDMSIDGDGFHSIQYQNANNSVRVDDKFMQAVEADEDWQFIARTTGEPLGEPVKARELMREIAEAAHRCADPGVQYDTVINEWHTCPNSGRINASNPCSEYMHVDDSACNLASLNLMKFRRPDGTFDTDAFEHAVDIVILAQDITVGTEEQPASSFPTEEIGINARAFRQLGMGYANLGAYLMSNGMPYDSDEGRATAAAITALMNGRAYWHSAIAAGAVGPYARYSENREPHNNVMRLHREAAYKIPDQHVPDTALLERAREVNDDMVDAGEQYGYRNAQATVLAPTGTISFLMDCDTTGVEPDFSLVKHKELVGGGQMVIVNRTVPMALETLGYTPKQISTIERHINDNKTIIGAPELKDEHLPVFDVAVGERAISWRGHVDMMGAVQPFISGAISKTINMPETATVEEIQEAFVHAWKIGVKALAIYRDGSKTAQALRTDAQDKEIAGKVVDVLVGDISTRRGFLAAWAKSFYDQFNPDYMFEPDDRGKRKLPNLRPSYVHAVNIIESGTQAKHKFYFVFGLFPDGTPGEMFMVANKTGSFLSGIMGSMSKAMSDAFKRGTTPEEFIQYYRYEKYEPQGFTNNPDIPQAMSPTDYIAQFLGTMYWDDDDLEAANINTREVRRRAAERLNGGDVGSAQAESTVTIGTPKVDGSQMKQCDQCGGTMQRTGSCYTCSSCGNNTGCG
jgi:ribonucleoside-diphosphate reductase alpha chain